MLKRNEVEWAFLGIIWLVKEKSEGMDTPEESTITQKWKWDRIFPSAIHAVFKEFDNVFPQDLPLGLPPVCEGHEFKIDLEDEVPPDEPAWARRGLKVNREHARVWLCQTIRFSLWCPNLVRTQERWEPSVLHWPPLVEQENGQEQISPSLTRGIVWLAGEFQGFQ